MATKFINFFKTLEAAMTVNESPITQFVEYRGVQLLPNNPLPYVQSTSHPTGINLEDWTVKVYSACGNLLGDITDYFNVDRIWIDDYAQPQIDWSVKNIPTDFGTGLVYLFITQSAGENFWTNVFQITDYDSAKTKRFDYKDDVDDTMLSIQLRTFFRQSLNRDEITTYYETSTQNTVVERYRASRPQRYFTELFSNELFVKFCDMLNTRFLYCDLIRCNLFEAFKIPELTHAENFAEQEYLLSFSNSDVYDPNYVAPVVPTPTEVEFSLIGKKNLLGRYFITFKFQTPADFTTVIFPQSSAKFNADETSGNDVATAFVPTSLSIELTEESETILRFSTEPRAYQPIPNQINLTEFTVQVSDIDGNLKDLIFTPLADLIFTQSDITNGIEKLVNATIVTI